MLGDLNKYEGKVGVLKDSYARMHDREEVSLRVLMTSNPSKMTRVQIDQRRRAEMVAANTAKFGKQSVGIHGGELPKFAETKNSETWWKH